MDAALTRDTLGRLLAEENAALGEFASLLDKEHGALRGRDIDALEALGRRAPGQRRQTARRSKTERRSLCSMLGYDTDLAGLAKLIAWCDPARTLGKRYEECATRARDCRDLNDSQWRAGRRADQARRRPARRHDRRLAPSPAPMARVASRIPTLPPAGKVLSAEA